MDHWLVLPSCGQAEAIGGNLVTYPGGLCGLQRWNLPRRRLLRLNLGTRASLGGGFSGCLQPQAKKNAVQLATSFNMQNFFSGSTVCL